MFLIHILLIIYSVAQPPYNTHMTEIGTQFLIFNIENSAGHVSMLTASTAAEGSRLYRYDNKTLDYPILAITDFPFGISEVFDDAKDVFRKVVGKMIAKKKLVGIDSGWYW